MNITSHIDKDTLYIALDGRIDASNANIAEEKIFEITRKNTDKPLVIDADDLEYISSFGLRMLLKIRKESPNLEIVNASSEIYSIFEMTGFTEMISIKKAYPKISIDGCEFIAKGANGAVYRYDDETIVKVYFAADALSEIQQERENARKAFVLGVNTAIPYGIVRVGDYYGTLTELLNSTSVSKLIQENPNDLELPAKYFIDTLKSIHSINVNDGDVPSMKDIALEWVDFVEPHIEKAQAEKVRVLITEIPNLNTLLHGDYHTNNIMLQNGEPVIIDMDTLCMGHPVFELSSIFNAFIGYPEIAPNAAMEFFGCSFETTERFYKLALKMYLNTTDEQFCEKISEKAMVIGYTRMLRRALRRPLDSDSPAKIARCKEMLDILLKKVDSLDFSLDF